MVDLDDVQKRLKIIADTVNLFKSEAVQLRVVDALLAQFGASTTPIHHARTGPTGAVERTAKPRRRRKAVSAPSDAKEKAPRKPSRTSGSPGAHAMITELIASGFFRTPKTIGTIVDHCKSAHGHHYKANECSPALLRLLRDKKLTREKNRDGQYEYTQT